MKYYFYLFEVHSIQSYILSSGKLKDMVGASELLESLLQKPLDHALSVLDYKEGLKGDGDYDFSRRGSSAFSLLFTDKEKAIALRDLWGLIIEGIAPGLSFGQSISDGAETPNAAYKQAAETLRTLRLYRTPELPVAGPLVRRSPRTGKPSVRLDKKQESPEWIDLATQKKRQFSSAPELEKKFDPDKQSGCRFPSNTDTEFPVDTTRYVGILHADANALGNITSQLADELSSLTGADFTKTFKTFSEKINLATTEAAQLALAPIINNTKQTKITDNPFLPFRPLVLGGDDLTVIIGEFAFDFARDFLEFFEQKTKEHLAELQEYDAIPEQLTACAGLAFIKINQPFRMGYRLAESLTLEAKQQSKALVEGSQQLTPSSMVFHRVSTSMIEDYSVALPRELTAWDGDDAYQLTLGAYGVGGHATQLPALDDLLAMKQLFRDEAMSRGPMRHFTTLLHESIPEARKSYARWQENMQKLSVADDPESPLASYNELTDRLLGSKLHECLPFVESSTGQYRSFLGDMSTWMAVEGENND